MKKKKKIISEVRIRNVNAAAIARIDQLAEASNFRSRNDYLRHYIESLSVMQDLKDQENRTAAMLETLIQILGTQTAMLESLKHQIDRLEQHHD